MTHRLLVCGGQQQVEGLVIVVVRRSKIYIFFLIRKFKESRKENFLRI